MKCGIGLVLTLASISMAGCARLNSIERTENLPGTLEEGRGSVLMIDAKQRVVYSVSHKQRAVDGSESTVPVYCAEPSPDALSAYAANTGLSLSPKEASALSGALNTAESSASIGLRTQSIQLMRDIMFRECEAFVNGADHDVAFMTAHRRLQSSMVAILAIEQLTGATKADQFVLSPKADPAAAPSKDTDSPNESADDDADKVKKAKAADDAAGADLAKKKKIETDAVADANQNPADATKQKAAADAKSASATATTKKSKTAAALKESKKPKEADLAVAVAEAPSDKAAIAAAVQGIVNQTLELAFSRELCVTVLSEYPNVAFSQNQDNVVGSCINYLRKTVDRAEAENEAYRANTKRVEACTEALKKSKDGKDPCVGLATTSDSGPGPFFTSAPAGLLKQPSGPSTFHGIQFVRKSDRKLIVPIESFVPVPSPTPPPPRP